MCGKVGGVCDFFVGSVQTNKTRLRPCITCAGGPFSAILQSSSTLVPIHRGDFVLSLINTLQKSSGEGPYEQRSDRARNVDTLLEQFAYVGVFI